jgi:LacI family transcriptional regulator, galactose operon repressor
MPAICRLVRFGSVKYIAMDGRVGGTRLKDFANVRSTLVDVAREAGVSTATVDRVLNNRGSARSRTRDLVLEAAARLGYIAQGERGGIGAPAPAEDIVRLHFALPDGNNSFIAAVHHQIEAQAKSRPDLDVHVEIIEGFNPDTLARTLSSLRGRAQGVGVIAIDHPTVREALRSLAAESVEVVTIASDVHHVPRAAYIGIDNRAAGRLIGYLLNRFLGKQPVGKVALFAGSLSYRGHEEREMGFRHVLEEMSPSLQIVELREMRDDWRRAYAEAAALLDRHPDLAAIYNVGAGNTGIAQALKERGREHSVIFLGHEATDDTRELLLDGTIDAVIDQNPRVEAREALNVLSHRIRGLPYAYHAPRLQVIFRENIPEV